MTDTMRTIEYVLVARLLFGEFAVCNYADQQPPQAVATAVRERLQHRGWPLECSLRGLGPACLPQRNP
jgi:hypothetical protein